MPEMNTDLLLYRLNEVGEDVKSIKDRLQELNGRVIKQEMTSTDLVAWREEVRAKVNRDEFVSKLMAGVVGMSGGSAVFLFGKLFGL